MTPVIWANQLAHTIVYSKTISFPCHCTVLSTLSTLRSLHLQQGKEITEILGESVCLSIWSTFWFSYPQFEEDVDRKHTLWTLWHNSFFQPRHEVSQNFPSSSESSFPFADSSCLFLSFLFQTDCRSLICKSDIFPTPWRTLGIIRNAFIFSHLTFLLCSLLSSVVSRCCSNTSVIFKTVNLTYFHLSKDC